MATNTSTSDGGHTALAASSSWPGAEDVLGDDWVIENSCGSLVASFAADETERQSLVLQNRRLTNQVEVLAALAGRPCSGLASRCAVRLQVAARRRRARRTLGSARSAAVRLQRASRGHRVRTSVARWQQAATKIQALQRAHLAWRAVDAATRHRAAKTMQRAVRAYLAFLGAGPSKTALRRQALVTRRELDETRVCLARHNATLDNVVAAHSVAAGRARQAEAQGDTPAPCQHPLPGASCRGDIFS